VYENSSGSDILYFVFPNKNTLKRVFSLLGPAGQFSVQIEDDQETEAISLVPEAKKECKQQYSDIFANPEIL